jgi:hypothetical protein
MSSRFLILGKGALGEKIHSSFVDTHFTVQSISVRSIDPSFFTHKCYYDIIIDCMDPASQDCASSLINDKIAHYRSLVLKHFSFRFYNYISSANIYAPAIAPIDEAGEILSTRSLVCNDYLRNKINTEQYLFSTLQQRLRIMRPVALWQEKYPDSAEGFFPDLFRSRASNSMLKDRAGDSSVFSFMNISDAALLIRYALVSMIDHFYILNVTSSEWASRAFLKTGAIDLSIDDKLGRRITSSVLSPYSFSHHFRSLP